MHSFRPLLFLSSLTICLLARPAASEPAVGIVKIISEPEGATIYVDGHIGGVAPTLLELSPGIHVIAVFSDGYAPKKKKVTVSSGRVSISRFIFTKKTGKKYIHVRELQEGGSDSGTGTVTVVTDPPGLTVLMDSQSVPKATPVAFDIHSGVYKLSIKQHGAVVLEKTIVVQPGRYLDLDYTFRKRRTIDEMDPWK